MYNNEHFAPIHTCITNDQDSILTIKKKFIANANINKTTTPSPTLHSNSCYVDFFIFVCSFFHMISVSQNNKTQLRLAAYTHGDKCR